MNDAERMKAWREKVTPLLEPAEQRVLVDEIVGRLQEQVARWVAEAVIQPGRVSAWRILFDAEWKAKPAIDVLFHELRQETARLEGKSPAPDAIGCPKDECTGVMMVIRHLVETRPLKWVEGRSDGRIRFVEAARVTDVRCEKQVVRCTVCGCEAAPEDFQELIASDAEAQH
jgi:hypothetical protein